MGLHFIYRANCRTGTIFERCKKKLTRTVNIKFARSSCGLPQSNVIEIREAVQKTGTPSPPPPQINGERKQPPCHQQKFTILASWKESCKSYVGWLRSVQTWGEGETHNSFSDQRVTWKTQWNILSYTNNRRLSTFSNLTHQQGADGEDSVEVKWQSVFITQPPWSAYKTTIFNHRSHIGSAVGHEYDTTLVSINACPMWRAAPSGCRTQSAVQ